MKIRDAELKDYKEIYRLNRDGLGYDYPVEKTKEKLKLILSSSFDKIFVAEQEGSLIGYIHLSVYECSYYDSLKNILALVVDENSRRMGIGKKLIQAAEEWAKKCGSSGVRLVSSAHREGAHKFYLNCGYTLRKEQKNFIKLF